MGRSRDIADGTRFVDATGDSVSGNFGVGISTPVSRLTVKGSGGNGTIRIVPDTDNAEASVGFYQTPAGTNYTSRWVAGVGGWGHTNQFTIGVSSAARLKIDDSGRVTLPYQPAFNATAKDKTVLGTAWQTIDYSEQVSQRGSHYNSTNYRFTAPVSGWYQFNATWSANANSDLDGTMSFALNGSTAANFGTVSMPDTSGSYDGHTISACVFLSVGDYVTVKRYSTVSTTTRDNHWCGNFSGYLIG